MATRDGGGEPEQRAHGHWDCEKTRKATGAKRRSLPVFCTGESAVSQCSVLSGVRAPSRAPLLALVSMARHTVVRLVDRNGLRPEPAPKKAAPRPRQPKKAAASAADPLRSAPLPPEEAFERRRRALSFWQSAEGDAVTLRMREDTVCAGGLLAVDAAQTSAHVAGLATPMGTYPFATVRLGDVLRVEFDGLWRVSPVTPALREPSAGAAGSGGGGSGVNGASLEDAKQAVTDGGRAALQDAKRALAATFDRQLSVATSGAASGAATALPPSGAQPGAEPGAGRSAARNPALRPAQSSAPPPPQNSAQGAAQGTAQSMARCHHGAECDAGTGSEGSASCGV